MKLVQSKSLKILCAVLSVMITFSMCFTAQAKSTSELRDEKKKIQAQIDKKQEEINALKSEKSKKQEYVSALQGKVTLQQDKLDSLNKEKSALQKEISDIEAKIKETTDDINQAQIEIDKKQAEFEEIYQQYCQRLRAMYISGNVSTLEVLLESGDMSSVLTRAQMVKCVSAQDSATLDSLMRKMQEIEEEKKVLEEKKVELNENKKKLDSQKAELQSSIDEVNKVKAELSKEVAECNAAIRELASTESEIMETIEADRDAQRKIDAEIAAASSSSSHAPDNYTPGSGRLAYPTSYRNISAGYPNYKSGAYHGGVDFPCPTGTPVYAADSGYVAIAKSLTYSYGKYILINHGNGLSTLYAHNSQLCVSQGQAVEKGQLIAYSGSTGNSSGPHCHFEVRLNGNRVNPLNYLG